MSGEASLRNGLSSGEEIVVGVAAFGYVDTTNVHTTLGNEIPRAQGDVAYPTIPPIQ